MQRQDLCKHVSWCYDWWGKCQLLFPFKIAKVEKLKPMELELKKLEDLSEAIVNDFAYMRAREEEMRDTNGNDSLTLLYWIQDGCFSFAKVDI